MEYSQIANVLNTTIVPNLLGEGVTIAEDLSNITDLGTPIANVADDDLKDVTGSFVAAISRIYVDERIFKKNINRMYKTSGEFLGVVQRIKAGLMQVTDDLSRNLENGTTYNQDVFSGMAVSNLVYTKNAGFELDWSVPHNMWKDAFTSIEELMKLIGYIGNRAEQTVNAQLYALQLTTLRALIVNHAEGRIKLLTIYNQTFNSGVGATPLTFEECETDADFLRWACEQISLIKTALTDISAKYNDGTITTFTPETDIDVTLLSKFAKDIQFHMTSDVFNKELVDIGDYDTVNFWQNAGTEKLPNIGVNAEIKEVGVTEGADPITIPKVVAVVRDHNACGITSYERKVTSHYNAKGDFTNYFKRVPAKYYIDLRENSVVFTLE